MAATEQQPPEPQPRDEDLVAVEIKLIEDPGVEVRQGLKTSMQNLGQRIPVKLRQRAPKRKTNPPRYEIIDGKHRIAAAIALEMTTIKAVVERIGKTQADKHDRAMETLVANAVRERNLGAEAEAVAILLGTRLTPEDISKRTGVPLRTVKELAQMKRELVPEVFDKVKSGDIARGAALKMLKLDPVRQRDLIEELEDGKEVTTKDADEAVRSQRNDMLDKLDKVRPQATADHTQLGHAVQAVAGQYNEQKQKVLLNAAAILRGE